jgi:hypothetical protein
LSEVSPKLTTSTSCGIPLSRIAKSAAVNPRIGRRDESVTRTSTRMPSTRAENIGCVAIVVVDPSRAIAAIRRIIGAGS